MDKSKCKGDWEVYSSYLLRKKRKWLWWAHGSLYHVSSILFISHLYVITTYIWTSLYNKLHNQISAVPKGPEFDVPEFWQ